MRAKLTAIDQYVLRPAGRFNYDQFMPWIRRWLARHQHPASQALHAFAIPLLPGAAILAALQVFDSAWGLWWRPMALIVFSYALQWLGHRIEGNDMGEWILIKRMLHLPYVSVSPRYARRPRLNGDAAAGASK